MFTLTNKSQIFCLRVFPPKANVQSLQLWFCLLSKCRREAIRLLTKPPNAQARRQSQSQWAKEFFSRWLQRDTKRVHLEKTQSDGKGQQNTSESAGDRLHVPGSTPNPEVTEQEASELES